jgi:hypothetical protein
MSETTAKPPGVGVEIIEQKDAKLRQRGNLTTDSTDNTDPPSSGSYGVTSETGPEMRGRPTPKKVWSTRCHMGGGEDENK